jgi:ArsR family transcriptional regulator, arsenate/arsenite/antimonite-responsive transcriptional repressor
VADAQRRSAAGGLLGRDKRGVWVYYRARTEALASLGTLIGYPPAST